MGKLRAALYDAMNARFERAHGGELRRRQLAAAHGDVLEVGGGTGANLPHYPKTVERLVVSEPDGAMLERARSSASENAREVEFVQATAEALPFGDASFDTVVTTI